MVRTWVVLVVVLAAACGDSIAGTGTAPVTAPPATSVAAPATSTAPPSTEPIATTTTAVGAAAGMAEGCADVVEVEVRHADDGSYAFDVTVRSADTGDEKYADAWEVRGPDGAVMGTRVLTHPHVNEQPFTRSLTGVVVPPGITDVTIAARDSVVGFCGAVRTVALPG